MSDTPPPPPPQQQPPTTPQPPPPAAAAQAPPPVAAGAGARGPVGTPVSPGKQILLTIVTLGIWAIVWSYRTGEDLKNYRGQGLGGLLWLILHLIVGFVVPFIACSEVEAMYREEGEEPPVTTLFGLWILLPIVGAFIWYLKTQRAINDFWIARGAPAP